jgi:hypothetical protein
MQSLVQCSKRLSIERWSGFQMRRFINNERLHREFRMLFNQSNEVRAPVMLSRLMALQQVHSDLTHEFLCHCLDIAIL